MIRSRYGRDTVEIRSKYGRNTFFGSFWAQLEGSLPKPGVTPGKSEEELEGLLSLNDANCGAGEGD